MISACRNILSDGLESVAFRLSSPGIRWKTGADSAREIRVSYGFQHLPTRGDQAGGGIIKVLDLARCFPGCNSEVTLLYLVSSALPPHAPAMVRQAKRAGVRIVVNQNGVAYPAWHGKGWEQSNRPLQKVLEQADYIFYQSKFCKQSADLFVGPPRCAFEILHNAVDTSVFRPQPRERTAGVLTLLMAGSHCQFYRIEAALRTLAQLRKNGARAMLLIAGRLAWCSDISVARQAVATAAQNLQIAPWVEMAGPYSQAEAVGLFNRADILLHTQYNDSCPRLVIEAMACGLPVVYSSSGGTPELVGEQGGRGVPAPLDWQNIHPPAPEELAAAIMEVTRSREAYAENARARAVALFDVKRWVERHREVFLKLIMPAN